MLCAPAEVRLKTGAGDTALLDWAGGRKQEGLSWAIQSGMVRALPGRDSAGEIKVLSQLVLTGGPGWSQPPVPSRGSFKAKEEGGRVSEMGQKRARSLNPEKGFAHHRWL